MDYREEQKINVAWIRWMFIITSVFTFIILFATSSSETENSEESELYFSIILVASIMGLSYALVFMTTLITEVRNTGFHYKYRPFVWKEKVIGYDQIVSWKMFVIKDWMSYGGYGYRSKGFSKTTGFIMGSKDAVEFTLSNDKKMVFTTTSAYMLQSALRKHIALKETV